MRDQPVTRGRRILFLTSSAPRFATDPTAPFILNMARDLQDLGWQVEILAPHAPGLAKHEIIDGVSFRRFQYGWPAKWQTLCYGGGAALNLKRNKRNLAVVPFFAAAVFLAALACIIRERPALIHSHWVIPQGILAQLLSVLGVRHVISVHGADIYGFRGQPWRALKAWALRRCDHVVVNSASTRTEVEVLCRPKAISTIPTGTTPPERGTSAPRERTMYADADTKIVLFVGRLIEGKGVRYLIEALPAILTRQRVKLLIVGDGPERPALENLARELNVLDRTIFAGSVPHAEIYGCFSLADVFVGPSIAIPGEWTEAQGNTFVEALFARVPVVASRVGGIPDAIVHERTGLLVDERAPAQIAQSVLRILSDPALAETLRESGHDHAARHFSRYASAQKLDATYRAILGSGT